MSTTVSRRLWQVCEYVAVVDVMHILLPYGGGSASTWNAMCATTTPLLVASSASDSFLIFVT